MLLLARVKVFSYGPSKSAVSFENKGRKPSLSAKTELLRCFESGRITHIH